LLSENCIKYTTVEKGPDGMRPRTIERPGPVGLVTTSTLASLHPENETRLLSLNVKDDMAQTRRVLGALAERANGHGPAEPDLGPWRALQEWLGVAGEHRVTIPFARELAERASARAVRLRRDFSQVLALIQAHAILQQRQRQRDAEGRIVATLDDYRAVYDLVLPVISEGVEATVSPAVRETVEVVAAAWRETGQPVTVLEVARRLRLDKSAASRRVRVALDKGYIVNEEQRRGRPAQLVPGEALPEEEPVLPAPEDLAAVAVENPTVDRETPWAEERGGGMLNPLGNTATVQPRAYRCPQCNADVALAPMQFDGWFSYNCPCGAGGCIHQDAVAGG